MTSIPSGGRLSYSTIAMFYAVFVLLCMLPLGAMADINKPPVATEQPKLSTKEDTKKSITLSGKDPEKKKLTYAIVSQPSHGTLMLSGYKATYVPTKDYFSPAGQPDSFTFKVNDGLVDSAPATVTINVTPVNDKPIALGGSVVAVKDSVREIALSATDVEEGMLTYTPAKKSKKGGAVALKANNIVTYTPKKNFVGADSFTFTVKDSQKGVSKAATVAVTVNGTNTAPKADAGADQNVDEKTTVTLDGSASTDTDGTIVSYAWVQTAGTAVTLSGATAAKPTFAAPEVTANETLTFELTVADNNGVMEKDAVAVTVNETGISNANVKDGVVVPDTSPEVTGIIATDNGTSTVQLQIDPSEVDAWKNKVVILPPSNELPDGLFMKVVDVQTTNPALAQSIGNSSVAVKAQTSVQYTVPAIDEVFDEVHYNPENLLDSANITATYKPEAMTENITTQGLTATSASISQKVTAASAKTAKSGVRKWFNNVDTGLAFNPFKDGKKGSVHDNFPNQRSSAVT